MSLITTTQRLTDFCARQQTADFVSVDTEFMRERTFWPKLCLVQIGGQDESVAIDPLAEGIDLTPMFDLLNNPKVLKVFHAARQDVEIFYNLTGSVPAPMFDTQVAAMVCGFGEAASYETLAASLAKAKVDKTNRFTDWAQRPLSSSQLTYALGDVIYLRDVYLRLKEMLAKNNRAEWVQEEMATLTNPATYASNPRDAWHRLKLRGDKPRLCALAQELSAWRDTEAQRVNVPRGRILRDEALLEIAYHPPRTTQDLAHIRGLNGGFAEGRQGAEILKAVARALELPADQCPTAEKRRHVPNGIGPVVDLLKVLLKQVSEEHGVAQKLIATTDDLEDLASTDSEDTPTLRGWRREIFGTLALALKKGELVLGLKGKKVVITRVKEKQTSAA
ncbi:MAG: ribonuclease D [Alphaproteobacteria bacterium]|nr:ribonuclease D [Alphaproteobacteria bacterium]